MAIDQYCFWAEWSEEDGEWVGLCDGFPMISWLEPDREAAESGIRAVVAEAIEHLSAQDKPLPKPGVKWPPQVAAAQCQRTVMGTVPDPIDDAEDAEDHRELAAARADDDYILWDEVKVVLGLSGEGCHADGGD